MGVRDTFLLARDAYVKLGARVLYFYLFVFLLQVLFILLVEIDLVLFLLSTSEYVPT